ncbi:DMT family transporter [Avibacterium sp. 21-586]|uniref:DMT family transporter n=1 Tax=Avibacterium sp. 21-586 TaxID=2911534 RepID=UPI0022477BC6|nr:DMT family transporter [Avibacterium sp. 21-586]MCW9710454.1 DMT family transporter [Avibacterium sp. 21-586]
MNKQHYGYLCLILATLFWGGNYIFGKMLSREVDPIVLTYLRWFPAVVILLLLFAKRTLAFYPTIQKTWKILTALSLLGIVIFPLFLYQGLQTTTALNASIYLAVVPIAVLLLNRLVFGDKIHPLMLAGAVVSFFGVLCLLSQGDPQTLLQFNVNKGDLWAIGSALSWALYCCIIRLRPTDLPNAVMLTLLVAIAMLCFSPFFLWKALTASEPIISQISTNHWAMIGYLVIGPSILSYALWNYGISLVGGAKGAVFTNVTPLFAALLGISVLGEALYWYHFASGTLIVLGLLMCNRKG